MDLFNSFFKLLKNRSISLSVGFLKSENQKKKKPTAIIEVPAGGSAALNFKLLELPHIRFTNCCAFANGESRHKSIDTFIIVYLSGFP